YKVIKKGNGKIPTLDDNVRVNYEGSFIDGTVFDSSYKRSESTVFGVKNVIKGWVEALTIMPVGSEWELYIPYQLGYGEGGNSGIPAYSVLKFKIELLNIE
ncbi:MAG: FKBP-type peptidyl-prolyl cis-trans isomerase, partial [Bacteroidaceae bacterium]|nr:FKBP-type peptidyl-prolyl cis-trans isomerase [Bacteroidaceae bacterium]